MYGPGRANALTVSQMDVFWDTVKAFARPVKAPEQAQPATADAPKPDAETPSKQEMPRGPFPGQG